MNKPATNTIELTAPTWNELPRPKLLQVFALLTQGGHLPELPALRSIVQRLRTFYYLAQLTPTQIADWEYSERQDHNDAIDGDTTYQYSLHQACELLLQHLVQPDPDDPTAAWKLQATLTRCPYPELKGRDKLHLYGPAHGLDNLTIYELGTVFTLLESYFETPLDETLHELFAVLYRPTKPPTPDNLAQAYQGDRRLPYRLYEGTVPGRKALFRRLSPLVLQVLLFWVVSCRAAIVATYPRVFDKKNKRPREGGNDYGWGGVLLGIADNIANLDRVADTNCHTIFTHLSMLEDQRLEMELWGKK